MALFTKNALSNKSITKKDLLELSLVVLILTIIPISLIFITQNQDLRNLAYYQNPTNSPVTPPIMACPDPPICPTGTQLAYGAPNSTFPNCPTFSCVSNESYCNIDADCGCGIDAGTNQCAIQNKASLAIGVCNTPDFCTGFSGDCFAGCQNNRCQLVCPSSLDKPTCSPSSIPPSTGYAPLSVVLHGGAIGNGDAFISGYQWDFENDGSWDTDISIDPIQHTYDEAGTYQPKYRVRGSNGSWSDVCDYAYDVNVYSKFDMNQDGLINLSDYSLFVAGLIEHL